MRQPEFLPGLWHPHVKELLADLRRLDKQRKQRHRLVVAGDRDVEHGLEKVGLGAKCSVDELH